MDIQPGTYKNILDIYYRFPLFRERIDKELDIPMFFPTFEDYLDDSDHDDIVSDVLNDDLGQYNLGRYDFTVSRHKEWRRKKITIKRNNKQQIAYLRSVIVKDGVYLVLKYGIVHDAFQISNVQNPRCLTIAWIGTEDVGGTIESIDAEYAYLGDVQVVHAQDLITNP